MVSGRMHALAGVLAAAALSLILAACQTGGAPGASAGASGSGFAYLTELRSSHDLPALTPDATLERAALRQAGYMAQSGRMKHTTGWRRDFATRMKEGGVDAPAAENLAHGRMEMARLFKMWTRSAGHRRNMLDPRFSRFGLAYASADDGQRYWALVLGK